MHLCKSCQSQQVKDTIPHCAVHLWQEGANLSVHGGHSFGHPLHGLRHAVVRLQRLNLQTDGLDVRPHHDELLHIASSANKVLRHDLHCILQKDTTF